MLSAKNGERSGPTSFFSSISVSESEAVNDLATELDSVPVTEDKAAEVVNEESECEDEVIPAAGNSDNGSGVEGGLELDEMAAAADPTPRGNWPLGTEMEEVPDRSEDTEDVDVVLRWLLGKKATEWRATAEDPLNGGEDDWIPSWRFPWELGSALIGFSSSSILTSLVSLAEDKNGALVEGNEFDVENPFEEEGAKVLLGLNTSITDSKSWAI